MFQTELYKNFEQQLLSALQEEESLFNASQMIQRAMPELVSTLESGFSLMAASMQAMSTSHSAELQKLNKPWSEIFALGNAFFNQGDGSLHIPSNNSVRNTIDTAASLPTASHLTTYKLNRTIVTVTDVWREYANGLCGGPSVEYLEKELELLGEKIEKNHVFLVAETNYTKLSKVKQMQNALRVKKLLVELKKEEHFFVYLLTSYVLLLKTTALTPQISFL